METFNGTEYLKIDIANCYGLDKLNWDERIEWTNDHYSHLENHQCDAKHPILFGKAVRAMRIVETGEPINHIMGLDATSSGIQIMGAASGCIKTAFNTNLTKHPVRMCFYTSIANEMNKHEGVNVDTATVKKPVMTTFYGSTAQPKNVFGNGEVLTAFHEALEVKSPGAYELLHIIQREWNSYATEHRWTLPDGHVACVPVVETVQKNIEMDECDHAQFAYRTKVISPKIRSRSLAANVIHSIDGYITRQMVHAAAKQGFWIAPIHDCYYAHPNYMNNVRENYRDILAWIARSNIIENILSEIRGSKVRYEKHSNDLSTHIKESNYSLS
jgi:hypothetical protein